MRPGRTAKRERRERALKLLNLRIERYGKQYAASQWLEDTMRDRENLLKKLEGSR